MSLSGLPCKAFNTTKHVTIAHAKNNQVVSTFVGDMGAKDKSVDNLQYQMMVSSQTMPYDVEQVRHRQLLLKASNPLRGSPLHGRRLEVQFLVGLLPL